MNSGKDGSKNSGGSSFGGGSGKSFPLISVQLELVKLLFEVQHFVFRSLGGQEKCPKTGQTGTKAQCPGCTRPAGGSGCGKDSNSGGSSWK